MAKINPKLNSIIKRVKRNSGVGVIYNIPKSKQQEFEKEFDESSKFITINGAGLFTAPTFIQRLARTNGIKKGLYSMLPAMVKDKTVVLVGCDTYTPGFSKILDEFKEYRIPLIVMMSSEGPLKDFRNLKSYFSVFSIEQNFKDL